MLGIVIFGICVVGFVIWGVIESYGWGRLWWGLLGLFFGAIIGLLLCLVVLALGNACAGECTGRIEVKETTHIYAVKDNLTTEGEYYLFSGYVNEDLKYFYVYEDEVRGLATKSVPANISYIRYIEPADQPYIQKWTQYHENEVLNRLFFCGKTGYTFYLPEGSVITDYYNIDLE